MVEKITLQKFDDKFEDFYDMEADCFVLYSGCRGFGDKIPTEAKITDYDGIEWDCFLWSVEYIPAMDCYESKYKCYKGA